MSQSTKRSAKRKRFQGTSTIPVLNSTALSFGSSLLLVGPPVEIIEVHSDDEVPDPPRMLFLSKNVMDAILEVITALFIGTITEYLLFKGKRAADEQLAAAKEELAALKQEKQELQDKLKSLLADCKFIILQSDNVLILCTCCRIGLFQAFLISCYYHLSYPLHLPIGCDLAFGMVHVLHPSIVLYLCSRPTPVPTRKTVNSFAPLLCLKL